MLGTAAVLAGSVLPGNATAAVYCVETPSQLRIALAATEGNGIDDAIRLTSTYFSAEGSAFHAFVAAGESLTIEGGWQNVFGPCGLITNDAGLTELGGNGLSQVLAIEGSSGSGNISVRNLTIRKGYRTASSALAAGLSINALPAHTGDISVERVRFISNLSNDQGAGLYVFGRSDVSVRNSVFFGNASTAYATALSLYAAQTIHFTNNTVSGNLAGEPGSSEAAAHFGAPSGGNVYLSNNIFHANTTSGQSDLHADLTDTLIANDIQLLTGTPSPFSSGNVSVDPRFIGGGNLRLQDNSPLIDFGVNAAIGGVGTVDIAGYARINGIIDLGAYESASPLLYDGFE